MDFVIQWWGGDGGGTVSWLSMYFIDSKDYNLVMKIILVIFGYKEDAIYLNIRAPSNMTVI